MKIDILTDNRGVSELIGVLLMFAIAVIYLGILQSQFVPAWNKEIEASNFNIVYDDVLNMRQAIEDTAVYDMPRTAVLHISLDYPNRMFLHNARKPAASITALNDTQVTITYNTTYNGTSSTITNTMSTCTIKVKEEYNYYSVPEIIIEHGMIIGSDEIGKRNYTIDSPLLNNNEIDLSLLECNNMSVGTTSSMKLGLYPVSFNKADYSNASLSFSTNYPALWENYLMSIGFPSSSYSITGNTIKMFYSNASKLKITVTSINPPSNIVLTLTPTPTLTSTPTPVLTTIEVSPSVTTLNVSGNPVVSQVFTATAKNQNNAPMAGINISWTVRNSIVGSVSPVNAITDGNGNATTTFTEATAGTTMINATNRSVRGSAFVTVVYLCPDRDWYDRHDRWTSDGRCGNDDDDREWNGHGWNSGRGGGWH